MPYNDLNDHPFAVFIAGESYESPTEKAWLAWCRKVEKLLGHSLDGNQERDGYSLDFAYGAWEAGETAKAYAAEIIADRNQTAGDAGERDVCRNAFDR